MRGVLAKTRSALALLALLFYVFVFGAIVLYLGVVPASWVVPRRRRAMASAFMRLMSHGILGCVRMGGARLERSGTLPTDGPALIVMNHQSLLDICTLVLMSWPQAPAFVTRQRYGRGLPVVSKCVQMIGSPIIDPKRDPHAAVELMRAAATAQQNGVVLFPEGHRSKDGSLRAFRTAGAEALLSVQPMPIHVLATDGFWSSRTLLDFVFKLNLVRGRTQVLGRLEAPAPDADIGALMADLRTRIGERIERMRADPDLVPPSLLPPALVEAIRTRVLEAPSPEAGRAAQALAEAGEDQVEAVVFFGSRMTGARPGVGSALDFFVVARDEKRLYQAWRRQGLVGRSPSLLAALGHVLAPTSIALTLPGDDGPLLAKCAVSGRGPFERDTSLHRRDQFTLGRLFQRTSLVYARDEAASSWAVRALGRAHVLTYRWARPWLPDRFDVDEYVQALLRVSFSGEIRPEPVAARVATLWQAQQEYLRGVYGVLLQALEETGDLLRAEDGRFALRRPVGRWERTRLALYFRWSMVRATARWAKHVLSFEGWLDFLVRKARRHTGQEIVLTERERRAPLIFLWPRVWRYLRHKDD